MATEPRSYRQNCGLARSLDLLGERWTLLIVRELARGPKRFRDLEAGLAGIGANLLSTRLKRLEADGIAQRVESAPGVPAYGLTVRGDRLTVVLEDLALWGAELLEPPGPGVETRAVWAAMSMRAWMDRAPQSAPQGTYAFVVDDDAFWLRVADGGSQLRDGSPPYPPDATLCVGRDDFLALAAGRRRLKRARARLAGDEPRLAALFETFRMPPRPNLPSVS